MPLFRKSNGKSTIFRSINADLRTASSQGDVVQTLELLKKGAKFIPNKEGRTALHLAVSNAHTNVVQTLIEHGCDLNQKDKLGYTPLHRACFEGYEDIVRLLLDANAKVDEQDAVQENTALHEAAWRGHSSCVELLLKAKANVYVRNKIGATALHLASQNGYNLSCRLLLQHGCKPNVKDKYDDTPLHTACRYLHVGVARILLAENNINTNEQNKNGDTPLHLSCNLGQKKLSKMLTEHDARTDIKNKQSETPMDIAVRKQQTELVQVLKQVSSATKIRERLKLSQDPDSSWQLLFQDWIPSCQLDSSNGAVSKPCPNNLYAAEPGFSYTPNVQAVSPGDREQHFVDVNGLVHKGPVACYCAPLFYRLAKHNDEAHRELLEEIDACNTNLNGEICDLRQMTERKFVDLNRSVKSKLERERANCSQKMMNYFDQSQAKKQYVPKGSMAKLLRSKSESELETDVERERTTAAQMDSDSMSNASGDIYFDRYFLQNATLNRKGKQRSTTKSNTRAVDAVIGCNDLQKQHPTTTGRTNFDETVRQFNKIDMENLNDSSCTTPTTASSGNIRSTPRDSSARISLYSCQSNQSSSQQSSTNGGKNFQPPSVDSGYGTKVENSPVHLTFPTFLLNPTMKSSSFVHGVAAASSHNHVQSCCNKIPQHQSFDEFSSPRNFSSEIVDSSASVNIFNNNVARSPTSAFRPVLPSASKMKYISSFEKVAEVETQTDSSTTTKTFDSHEYTELECILRSATMNHSHAHNRSASNRIKDNLRNIKPSPILPIPPPPRKPLPPLPNQSSVHTKRRIVATGCLSTNV